MYNLWLSSSIMTMTRYLRGKQFDSCQPIRLVSLERGGGQCLVYQQLLAC